MKRILIVSPVECYPNHFGNSARIASIIEIFKQEGVTFHFLHLADRAFDPLPMQAALGDRYTFRPYGVRKKVVKRLRWRTMQSLLSLRPYRLIKVDDFLDDIDIALYKQTFDRFQPDTVWINYTYLSKLLLYTPSGIKKVIDTHDSMHLRYQSLSTKDPRINRVHITIQDEIAALNRADIAIGIQDQETLFFQEHGCNAALHTIGHQITYKPCPVHFNRKYLLYIGANYSANQDALHHFLQSIWPNLRSTFPEIRFVVAGSISQAFKKDEFLESGVDVRGTVDNLFALYQSVDIAINPVRMGSGLKIKNIEALSFGRPVISSTLGTQGLTPFIGRGLLVADDIDAWIKGVKQLLYTEHYYEKAIKAIEEEIKRYNAHNLGEIKSILAVD